MTVVADTGATRTLELTTATTVRLLDTTLRGDLNTYLELLDRNRTEGVRHLTLTDRGSGSRDLRVSFLSEVPVWSRLHRILFTDSVKGDGVSLSNKVDSATLQGFSVVDNTTGEDWKNVQLSLIAGSPQSFLQPLAQPIYARRPEVPIAQNAQLTPQTHASALEAADSNTAVAGMAGMGSGVPGGIMGGVGPGAGGNTGGGARRIGGGLAASGGPLSKNMNLGSINQTVSVASAAPMIAYETVAADSIVPNTTTSAFDDFFAYNLTDPVTIPRNGSALVPILQTRIQSERVTLVVAVGVDAVAGAVDHEYLRPDGRSRIFFHR